MIHTYEDLHRLVASVLPAFSNQEDKAKLALQIEENGLCAVTNQHNGHRFKFMLARFGEEYKVGFAFYEAYQPQPVWIDDVLSSSFDEGFIQTLFQSHLIGHRDEA